MEQTQKLAPTNGCQTTNNQESPWAYLVQGDNLTFSQLAFLLIISPLCNLIYLDPYFVGMGWKAIVETQTMQDL